MIITYDYLLEETKLLVNLCSRLKQLTIEKFQGDFKALLQFLLSKDDNKPHHLSSVCIKRVPDDQIEILKTFIESEKLLDNYSMKTETSWFNSIYLWW
jgi:hypothetical protein